MYILYKKSIWRIIKKITIIYFIIKNTYYHLIKKILANDMKNVF